MTRLFSSFARAIVVWTAIIGGLLLAVTALSGSVGVAIDQLPTWLGLALMLAAYPAGIGATGEVFGPGRSVIVGLAGFVAAALSLSLGVFVLVNVVGPAVLVPGGAFDPPHGLTLTALREAIVAARQVAGGGPPTPATWMEYNHLTFYYVRRTDGMILPALLAAVGLGVGYWIRLVREPRLRLLVAWGLGAFLTVSTYMAGENGYELVVTRMGGPAEFVGDFVLIVPGCLVLGLGLAVVSDLLGERDLLDDPELRGEGGPLGGPDRS